ncbi:hypothetical protein AX14_006995, partial [Amanita brunnescens Koide BX004]
MDPGKVKAVTDWPVPKTKKELQQFLGFVNFYRRFVKGFTGIAKPLTKLMGKEAWNWTQFQQEAFQKLKDEITSERTLMIPKPGRPFRMETDASDFAIAAILSQLDEDGIWKPIAFMSKSLNEAERNYEIYDKEMIAVMQGFYEWSHYLRGYNAEVEVLTDHQNLTYFQKPQNLNRRQARWILDLQEYNFTIKHRSGKSNTKADLLSRRADYPRGENDNQGVTLLKPEHFRNVKIRLSEDAADWIYLMDEIKKTHRRFYDKQVDRAIRARDPDWKKDDHYNVWSWKERIYVPLVPKLREWAVGHGHHHMMAGHPGVAKTLELITREFWWPNMKKDVENYIKGCHTCQTVKLDRRPKAAPLQPNEIPNEPWEIISVDLNGPLTPSKGKDMILVIVDRFSKKAYFLPTNTTVTSQGVANLYKEHIFKAHGLPKKVISDRGLQFVSGFMKGLYTQLGITANPSTAYHPQMDGQTERVNQELEEYLRIYVNEKQNDWVNWLPIVQFCHNDRQHSVTGYSPFMVTNGRHPFKGFSGKRSTTNQTAEEYINQFKKNWKEVKANLEKAVDRMKKQHDKKKVPSWKYKPGDRVYLDAANIKTTRASKKLDAKFHGLFKVLEAVGKSAYKLELPPTWTIHPTFHESKLKPAHEPVFPKQKETQPRPPPDIIDGEEEHEVETIQKVRKKQGKHEFLIKWKGLPQEEASWEPEEHMDNTKEAIKDFYKRNPTAIRRLPNPSFPSSPSSSPSPSPSPRSSP